MTEEPRQPHTGSGRAFTRTWLREGYEITEVEEFLDRAERALATRDGSVTAADVNGARFKPVLFGRGYDLGEVDRELDRLAAMLAESSP